MRNTVRETWITGVGIVSALGEGPDAHWEALDAGKVKVETAAFAPYIVHPLATVSFDAQIPKKGDQRQMEPWQRIGTYAAGLALESAGVKGNADVLGRMDMIVAAGGGERDLAADSAILTGLSKASGPQAFLNEQLMSTLRPTLFLAQLPNLLAGNISVVHGVTGSSRTFMGEEAAGVDSVRIAHARIQSGDSEIALVGGAYNGERKELLLLLEFGRYNLTEEFQPVWARVGRPGFAHGSMGAFLVLENGDHAKARGAVPLARLTRVASSRSKRKPGDVSETLTRLWDRIAPRQGEGGAFISGATGVEPTTSEERAFLASHPDFAARATGSHIGHGIEPQFAMNIALAATAVQRGTLFASHDTTGFERASEGTLTQAIVTSVGHWRGEGLALVEKIH
jgi:3-oxoacyl-[acyl-carrier-protein] synthase II